MADNQEYKKKQFFYPVGKYYGKFSPGNLAFNANLQEFAQRVSFICGLESNGKIPSEAAYREIKQLWNELKKSKKQLLDTPMTGGETPPEE